jgi:hypothetical protein
MRLKKGELPARLSRSNYVRASRAKNHIPDVGSSRNRMLGWLTACTRVMYRRNI